MPKNCWANEINRSQQNRGHSQQHARSIRYFLYSEHALAGSLAAAGHDASTRECAGGLLLAENAAGVQGADWHPSPPENKASNE